MKPGGFVRVVGKPTRRGKTRVHAPHSQRMKMAGRGTHHQLSHMIRGRTNRGPRNTHIGLKGRTRVRISRGRGVQRIWTIFSDFLLPLYQPAL